NRHEGAARADSEIGKSHRLASGLAEPSGEQHLTRKRPSADVPERVEEVEKIESCERGRGSQTDERSACHRNAGQHQPPDAPAIDDHPGEKAKDRANHDLAERISGSDLLPAPVEI